MNTANEQLRRKLGDIFKEPQSRENRILGDGIGQQRVANYYYRLLFPTIILFSFGNDICLIISPSS